MTAVAPPLSSFQPSTRIHAGWSSNGNGFGGTMSSDEVSKMFTTAPAPRKTVQRQNSSSSIASTSSTSSSTSTSTITAPAPQTNGVATTPTDSSSWAQRKKPTRALWPPGKAEPATGLSTARPQTVNTATSGPSATTAISALHTPLIPSQQMANSAPQTNGIRTQASSDPPVLLHLTPMNHTFERKAITVPYHPDVLRIGRQTNQKTIPTPSNGYFDSKVLSRQHAEVYADRHGRIFIRDVKSSNGTFVNGQRLSPENKESDPRELKEQDMLELGIDIVSEDQKTVVHHKVAAKVEHAGLYGQGGDALNFGELDPSAGGGLMAAPGQLRRNGSQGSLTGRGALNSNANQAVGGIGVLNQPQHMRNWLNPITTEHIVKKLNAELKYAMQQSQDLARARQSIEAMLGGKIESPTKEKSGSEKSTRPSPTKSKTDLKAHFFEPPAPPPSAPLPEKPDVARALADPIIQPILRRTDTAKPTSADSSPTRRDHSSDILKLCEELKLAKGQISTQTERMKSLEDELAQERTARESAEERAQRLEQGERKDSSRDLGGDMNAETNASADRTIADQSTADLQVQLDRLRTTTDEMKQQMESYRQRAEKAETERDEAKQSLAEMVEQKRRENAEQTAVRTPSRSRRSTPKSSPQSEGKSVELNGHAISPTPLSPTSDILLERAGVEEGQPITPEQAKILTQFLTKEILNASGDGESALVYHGRPLASAAAVVFVGVLIMSWMNGWTKLDR